MTLVRRRGLLLVLSSPSGAGKTSITRALVERDDRHRGEAPCVADAEVERRAERARRIDGDKRQAQRAAQRDDKGRDDEERSDPGRGTADRQHGRRRAEQQDDEGERKDEEPQDGARLDRRLAEDDHPRHRDQRRRGKDEPEHRRRHRRGDHRGRESRRLDEPVGDRRAGEAREKNEHAEAGTPPREARRRRDPTGEHADDGNFHGTHLTPSPARRGGSGWGKFPAAVAATTCTQLPPSQPSPAGGGRRLRHASI